jgi:hypothetical protein
MDRAQRKHLLIAVAVGVVATVPVALIVMPGISTIISIPDWLAPIIAILMIPAIILGLAIGHNVHDPSVTGAAIGNFGFYFWVTYAILRIRSRSKTNLAADGHR